MFGFKKRLERRNAYQKRLQKNYTYSIMQDTVASPIQIALSKNDPSQYLKNRRTQSAFAHYVDTQAKSSRLGRLRTFDNCITEEILFLMVLSDSLYDRDLNELNELPKRKQDELLAALKWMEAWVEQNLTQDLVDLKTAQVKNQITQSKVNLKTICDNEAALILWLLEHGPDPALWHDIVIQTDPDGLEDLYNWIVLQPDCDLGTAVQIFHHCAGCEALEYPNKLAFNEHPRRKLYETAKLVADRLEARNFKNWEYAANDVTSYGSSDYHYKTADLTMKKFGQVVFSLSPELFDISPRKTPNAAFYYSDF